jgi:hypothetical protein
MENNNNSDYVYFVYDKHSKKTKISKTKNVKKKFNSLLNINPELKLIYYTNNNTQKFYYSLFKDKKINKDWFNLSNDDLKKISSDKIIDITNIDSETHFKFKGIENLKCDLKGNFYYLNKPLKKYWRSSQIYIKIENKKYGMKTLRKLAYKVKSKNV